jgi:hypothetical protein
MVGGRDSVAAVVWAVISLRWGRREAGGEEREEREEWLVGEWHIIVSLITGSTATVLYGATI